MTAMLIALFILYFMATLIGIVCVIQEDVYYTKKQKILKILFIIFVPMIGPTIELYLLSKDIDFQRDILRSDIHTDTKVYKFFDDRLPDIPTSNSDTSPL